MQPASQQDASAAPGLRPASPRDSNPNPPNSGGGGGGGGPPIVDEAARQAAAGSASAGGHDAVDDGGKQKDDGASGDENDNHNNDDDDDDDDDDDHDDDDDDDDCDQEEQEEEEEEEEEAEDEDDEQEHEEEEEEEEEQSDYGRERAGSEEAGEGEEEEDRHDAVVVDLSEGSPKAAATATTAIAAPQGSQLSDYSMEQQKLQAIIDDVASFSVGGDPPATAQEDPAGDKRRAPAAATAVLTEAERGARAAKALAEAAAMQELSSKLFPLLVERLPEVLGQPTGEDSSGKGFKANDA